MNTNIISKYLQLLRKKHNFTQDELQKGWIYPDKLFQNGKREQLFQI